MEMPSPNIPILIQFLVVKKMILFILLAGDTNTLQLLVRSWSIFYVFEMSMSKIDHLGLV